MSKFYNERCKSSHAQLYKSSHALFDDLRSGINLRTLNITKYFFLQWTNNITYNQIIVILYVHNIYIILNTLWIFLQWTFHPFLLHHHYNPVHPRPKAGQYSPKAGQYSPKAGQYSPKDQDIWRKASPCSQSNAAGSVPRYILLI